jgi:NADPH:quinone reductase-like Zn-dependent oxidoreductase
MSVKTMKAVRYHDYGGPEQLVFEYAPVPEPGTNEVLVKIAASAVNPWDWKFRTGKYREYMQATFPMTPGIEASGTVAAMGPDVTGFREGQAVYGSIMSSNAEFAVVSATELFLKPDIVSFEEAAAIPVASQTAYSSLIEIGGLKEGQRVLIHGGAGSVGTLAIQIAKWRGAYVYTTGSTENLDFLRSQGADSVIDYTVDRFESLATGLDVILDTIGGETQDRSWQLLKRGGILVTLVSPPPSDKAAKMGVRSAYRSSGISKEGLVQIQNLVSDGTIRPVIRKVFPLADTALAHTLGETGRGRGKIIIKVADIR